MRLVLVSDLHLTDSPADEYRWRVFDQLRDLCQDRASTLWILGDLTQHKDYHSSRLVNRVVTSLRNLRLHSKINEIHILRGNHDGLDPGLPYFAFLNAIPWCTFHIHPEFIEQGDKGVLLLPHTRDYRRDWGPNLDWENAELVFAHCTVRGAISENGTPLDGIPSEVFSRTHGRIICGDVHVPQRVGAIEYIGAPYPVRFGDDYNGRMVYIEGRASGSVCLSNIRKPVITIDAQGQADSVEINKGDQVKIRIILGDEDLGRWHDLRREAQQWVTKKGGVLSACELQHKSTETKSGRPKIVKKVSTLTPYQAFDHYARDLDQEIVTLGKEFLDG